jgi:TonB-dependent starch-binding outer membrane protein SusC
MKKQSTFLKVLFLFLVWAFSVQAYAQDVKITGKVTDAIDGSSLPGVSIVVKGTTTGTITDIDGTFSLSVRVGASLEFSFIGYNKQELVVGSQRTLNVEMKSSATGLNEVVVIGYGQVKKSDATGSVAVVGSKDFNRGAITSPQELLVGKSAGVIITSNSGAPGSGSTIRIRGGSSLSASNDPLLVVDGVPLDNVSISGMGNNLNLINPNDIESFTVLKDASATAIYGSRASNGVILITTKKGKSGSKMSVSYNGNVSFGQAQKYVDVLSGDEFRSMTNERYGLNNIDSAALGRLGTANTDWQKEIYQTAVSTDHNISISGAYKALPYRASYGYTNQDGILKTTNMTRHTLAFSLNPSFLNDDLKVNINAKNMFTKNNFGNTDAIGGAVRFDPTQTVMNGNTRYGGYTTWTAGGINGNYNQMATANPVAQLELTDNIAKVERTIGSVQFDYRLPFIPNMHANLNMSVDRYNSKGHNNADTIAVWTRRGGYGRLDDYSQSGYTKTLDFTLNYTKPLDAIKSKLDVMGGYSWQHFYRENSTYDRSVVPTDPVEAKKFPLIIAYNRNSATENYLVSFFGRLNYSLMDRYLLTVTVRDDGSSRFAKGNQWGLFPSVALAWKLKNESFFKDVQAITDLKIRVGWGQTGQQAITANDYPYLGTYTVADTTAWYQFGNTWIPTLRPDAYDPKIKWETTTTKNIGLDFSFLNDRISGSIDYYMRETKDLINKVAIPNGSNFSNYLTTNVGNLENKGIEAVLNLKPVATKDMGWDIGFNFSYNKNEITKLIRTDDPSYLGVPSGGIGGGTGNNIQISSVGYPINSFFVLQQVYDINGMPIEGLYLDRSGDGGNISSNLDNFYRYKKPAPDYLIGISTRYSYKKFDIAASARLSIGNYVYNNVASGTFYGNLYNNNYWQNIGTNISDTKFNQAQYFSDFYMENASFFKLDNVSLGYNFDKLVTSKIKGRISLTVQNALTVTKYSGLDPEVDGGIDNNFYPRARIYMMGLNLDF